MTTAAGRKPMRKPALGPTKAMVDAPPANTGRPAAPAARYSISSCSKNRGIIIAINFSFENRVVC